MSGCNGMRMLTDSFPLFLQTVTGSDRGRVFGGMWDETSGSRRVKNGGEAEKVTAGLRELFLEC